MEQARGTSQLPTFSIIYGLENTERFVGFHCFPLAIPFTHTILFVQYSHATFFP